MSEPPAENRRKSQRFSLRLPARIGTEERMYDAMAADFSEGGLQIETSAPFTPGAVVMIYVHFPSSTIPLRGRVVRNQSGTPFLGLVITQGGSPLMNAYERWVKEFGREEPEAPPPERHEPADSSAEPRQAVRRRVETGQGNTFEILMDPEGIEWRLTIHPSPRNPSMPDPLLNERFKSFTLAQQALQAFLKSH